MGPESAEFPFKNCSNFTDKEITAIALARGTTAAVCCVTSFIAVVILALVNCCHHRVCETVLKRLNSCWVLGIPCAFPTCPCSAPHPLATSIQNRNNFCKTDGFLNQYLVSVQFLFALEINLVLFLKVCEATKSLKSHDKYRTNFTRGWNAKKIEACLFVLVFCLPLLFDWIPFATGSYGPFGPWCWIRRLENDCSDAGILERLLLQRVPLLMIGPLTLGLFITSLCLVGYAIKNAKAKKLNKVGITDSIFSLVLTLALYLLSMVFVFSSKKLTFWMVLAIAGPLLTTLTPFSLLIAIHLPLSSMLTRVYCNCYEDERPESGQATVHTSSILQQPSYTTWNPPHSANTDSQNLLLACDMHQQDYSSTA